MILLVDLVFLNFFQRGVLSYDIENLLPLESPIMALGKRVDALRSYFLQRFVNPCACSMSLVARRCTLGVEEGVVVLFDIVVS